MNEAATLRLVSIGAAVLCCGIAALLGASVVRSTSRGSSGASIMDRVMQALAFLLSALIIFVGYRVFRAGYTWGSYL